MSTLGLGTSTRAVGGDAISQARCFLIPWITTSSSNSFFPTFPHIKEVTRTGGEQRQTFYSELAITEIHSESLIAVSKTRKYLRGIKHSQADDFLLCLLRIQMIFSPPTLLFKGLE